MAVVTTTDELALAIASRDPDITIAANLTIDRVLVISYAVTIRGSSPAITITRAPTFGGHLFNNLATGNVAFQDIIIEGNELLSLSLVRTNGALSMNNVTLQNSNADRAGALYITGNTSQLTDTTVINCSCEGIGGAIYISDGGILNANASTISNNRAAGNGGAIYINQTSQLQCENVEFQQNVSGVNGGAVFANLNTATFFINTQLVENRASNGAGVFVNSNATLTVEAGMIVGNEAIANGGGIYVNQTSVATITNSSFDGNVANNGAGLFLNVTGTLNMNTTTFNSNLARNNGGGVYFNNETTTELGDCLFEGNAAVLGGGIFVNQGAGLLLVNSAIQSNQASSNGGGLFVNNNSDVGLTEVAVRNNASGANGGGVYVNFNGQLSVINSSLDSNMATEIGGAIANFGLLVFRGNVTVGENGLNSAGTAPGIYNGGTNIIQDFVGNANGLSIPSEDNVIQINGPLLAGSVNQLDLTEYVAPIPENSPIVVAVPTDLYPVLTQSDADAFLKPVVGFEDWRVVLLDNQVVLLFDPVVIFTITYNNVKGNMNPNPTTYQASDLPIELQNPGSVQGFLFVGWFDVFGEQITVIPEGTTGDLVLFARYIPVSPYPVRPPYYYKILACRKLRLAGQCHCTCKQERDIKHCSSN
ncbi:hypothetical protein ABC345_18025 [Shouchella sp. 1P09AA]|uniref:hypothetical protein n=1 Tax=unclassified Shouchella TaxID=2893065 RepID=UPI0039A33A3C